MRVEHQLSVTRVKIATAPEITARLIRKDNVTFANGCSLFISTNYRPQIRETDHGTWRRLEGSVPYPFTFRKPHEDLRDGDDRRGDGTLRQRITADADGRRAEAMLAWLAEGARQAMQTTGNTRHHAVQSGDRRCEQARRDASAVGAVPRPPQRTPWRADPGNIHRLYDQEATWLDWALPIVKAIDKSK